MKTHFSGNRKYLYDFNDLFLVHCPRCDKCAVVVPVPPDPDAPPNKSVSPYSKIMFTPRRLTCTHCGYAASWQGKRLAQYDDGRDWYFGCPLWLLTSCCGETLWAFNANHLQFLDDFVRASFRETHYNATLASRLPEWMKLGKNRADVLKCLDKLRTMLPST